jgi:hypothetical protein
LIKLNPDKHQYNSNWCLIGGSFCKESLFGRDTELQLKSGINSGEKQGFLDQKISNTRKHGVKWELKNIEMIILNLEIFGENFMIFG